MSLHRFWRFALLGLACLGSGLKQPAARSEDEQTPPALRRVGEQQRQQLTDDVASAPVVQVQAIVPSQPPVPPYGPGMGEPRGMQNAPGVPELSDLVTRPHPGLAES